MNTWVCLLCPRGENNELPEFTDRTAFLEHAEAAHQITEEKAMTSKGALTMALDGPDWYENHSQYTLPGEQEPWLLKIEEGERDRNDPMRG